MKKLNVFLAVLTAAVLCMAGMPATAAAQEIPEGYPAIVEGLDFGGATVYIYEWWNDGTREENPTDMKQLQYDYWDWLEDTYNVHVVETSLSDWGGVYDAIAEMVANGDNSKLCIIAVAGDFAGSVVKNQLFMDWTVGLDEGNTATQELVTVNGNCYGTTRGAASEPRQSVFFNKDVLAAADIDWHDIYAAQANGTWTWAVMEEYMDAVQRDTDNDEEPDIWGLTGNRDDITIGLMVSNGADFYDFDENGKLVPAIDSEEAREAIAKSKAWGRFIAPAPQWDAYKQNWAAGNVAFMIGQAYEGFNYDGIVNNVENWGYVAMPMGPKMDHYVTTVENNVYGVPNVYDEAMSRKLQQLFRLWTWDAPGTEDAWKAGISGITEDEDAIATYGMLRDPENGTTTKLLLLDGKNRAAGEILWGIDGEETVDELIDNALPAFQERCDDYNYEENIEWTLDDNGVLTISGTGKMKTHPWSSRAGEIREAIVEEGITTVCEGAFANCGNLTTVSLPYSLIYIDDGAFPDSCTSLTDIYYNGLAIDWDGGVLPWGCENNDPAYNAHMSYRATEPAGDNYPVTITGVRLASDETALTAGEDGFYTAGNNETVLVSFSAPAMEGYERSYRFCNDEWWDTPEADPETGAADYETQLGDRETEDLARTAMAVYVPADPAEPILLASQDISFHITRKPSGLTVSAPGAAIPGTGYILDVTVPETTDPAGGNWFFEGYKYLKDDPEGEFCFNPNSYGGIELRTGTNSIFVSEDQLLGPGRYDAVFSFDGVGYERFIFSVTFAVIDAWLPEDLETIESEAFAGADFRAVWVPDGCSRISAGAFADCDSLEFISIPADAEVEEGAWDNNVYVHRR